MQQQQPANTPAKRPKSLKGSVIYLTDNEEDLFSTGEWPPPKEIGEVPPKKPPVKRPKT